MHRPGTQKPTRSLQSVALEAAARIFPHVPPGVAYTVCEAFGGLFAPQLPAWEAILANLEVVMPRSTPAERERAARRVVSGIAKNYYDLFHNAAMPEDQLLREIVFDGAEYVERALDDGRGALVLATHTGTYSAVVSIAMGRFRTGVLLIVEQLADPHVHEVVNRLRRGTRLQLAPLGPSAGRAALRALRNNDLVVLTADRPIGGNTVTVSFFGRPTPLPSGPATLALRTGAPLVPTELLRRSDNRSWLRFLPPLEWTTSGDRQRDVRDVTQKIAYHVQEFIRRTPSQWLVAEPVWSADRSADNHETHHSNSGL